MTLVEAKFGPGHQRSAANDFIGPKVDGFGFHGRCSRFFEKASKLAMRLLKGASIVFVLTNLTDGLR